MKLWARHSGWWQAGSASLLFFCLVISVLAQPASPPVISFIPAQGVFPNATSRPIAFVVGDAQTSANLLSVSATSANQTLVPDGGIVFGGAGSNRSATIIPSLNQTGATTITITVTDANGGAASNSFALDVAYFTPVPSGLPALGEGRVAWGDYDNDGRLDVLITGASTNGWETFVFRNSGAGTFIDINAGLLGGVRGIAAWADFNQDGKLDVLVTGDAQDLTGSAPHLYRNDGDGVFAFVDTSLPTIHDGFSPGAAVWGDADNDGDLDLALSGQSTNLTPSTFVYRNMGDSTFADAQPGLPGALAGSLDWGDYDNDGDLDLAVSGRGLSSQYFMKVFRNDGKGVFSEAATNFPSVYSSTSLWGDYDNDGDLDLLTMGYNCDFGCTVLQLYRNNGSTNAPPAKPTGLSATLQPGNDVLLHWDASTDSQTPSSGLSYNLRVGTNSEGIQISSPQSDLATGFRRVAQSGPAHTNRWRLADLAKGTYYWSVQAVDPTFVGSLFSTQAVFTITNSRPVIGPIADINLFPGLNSGVIPFIVGDAETPALDLIVSTASSNTNLTPDANIVVGGSGSNRTVHVTPMLHKFGSSLITITVIDGAGLEKSTSFRLNIVPFTPLSLDLGTQGPGAIIGLRSWADYDNDDDLDLLVSGNVWSGAPLGVWNQMARNNSNGTFTLTEVGITNFAANTESWGDYDNDGHLDLVANGNQGTRVYHNNGDGTFVVAMDLPQGAYLPPGWMDLDNDGDLEFMLGANGVTHVYRNDGAGSFSQVETGLVALNAPDYVDADGDGFMDLRNYSYYYSNGFPYTVTDIYRNNGNLTFTALVPTTSTGLPPPVPMLGDFDMDGLADLLRVVSAGGNFVRVYHGDGSGSHTEAVYEAAVPAANRLGWGDADGDGDLDFFASDGFFLGGAQGFSAWQLFRNNTVLTNTLPSTPQLPLVQLLPDNAVLLTWQPANDLETTNAAGLSYDIRVGTTTGGVQYIAPSSNTENGYRRVPQRGRMSTNYWLLRDVPKGTFYWSVQAVDAALAGSPFSAENIFEITNARPLISPISNQVTVPGRATPTFDFMVSDQETPAAALTLTRLSLNPSLVPTENIVFGGSGSNRTVNVTPAPGSSGSVTIVVGVMDASGLVATSRFDVVVQTFTEVSVGLPANTAVATAWGDYDNDGDLDIATAGPQYGNTAVYRNSNGFFTNQNFTLPATGYYLTPTDLAWLDYDNDGDLDLAESGWLSFSSGYTPVTLRLRNNYPTNTFTSISTNLPGAGVTNIADGAMAWADYDNDGDLDVLLSGDTNTYHSPDAFTALYRNDRGGFTNSGVVLPALVRGAAVWGDYDNDGDLDLLMAGQTGSIATSSLTKLFRNEGNGGFTELPTVFPGVTDCALAFGDIDNDGDLDIALAGQGTNSVPLTRIYRNIGNGGFTNINANLLGITYASVAFGDYDNDGFVDLVVSGSTNTSPYDTIAATTRVYRNYGGGGFTNIGDTLPGVMMQNTSWGDFDNDGDLDLLVGTRLVRNTWNLINTPPTTPTNLLNGSVTNPVILLSWSPATDVETTNPLGLRYNLRFGTNSGGGQIFAPHADGTNGYRRVPDFGNIGTTNFWPIANLTNGTYYWSVQAIDGGLAGSAFAPEQTFVISRPIISTIANRTASPNSIVDPINFTVSDGETATSNLIVTASSSDPYFVPDATFVISGTGTNRTLTITQLTNRSGVVTITLLARDESGEFSSSSFLLTVEQFADIAAGLTAQAGPVSWGDFDNDGDLDLVKGTSAYRNLGSGVFSNLSVNLPYNEGFGGWNDFDRDGNLDLLVIGANASKVYRTDGNGNFTDGNVGLPAAVTTRQSGAWGDFDNDGDPDLALSTVSFTRIYRNSGTNFTDINAGLPSTANGSVAWGDFDKDGDLDLLLAGNNALRIYRNNGHGAFADLGANLPGVYRTSVAWADFDNDGDLDFVVAGSTNNAVSGVVTRVYRNTTNANPTLTFTNLYPLATQGPIGIWNGTVAWGDYDNDGYPDLLVTGQTTNNFAFTRLYRNNQGSFADSGRSLVALRNSFAAWGDYDGDGNLDLTLSGLDSFSANITRIYRNFPTLTNERPDAPSNLAHSVTGKSVHLSWTAASDGNQTNGLSYNVRVGSAPGAGNVFSPMAATNGARRLVEFGNANERLTWTITNLTGGTFYWSVQAVDHSFAGSAFAPEHSFVISNRLPLALAQTTVTSEDSSKSITLTGSDPDADPLTFNIATPPLFGQLTGTPPNITYRPATNYAGFDQFTFRAHDRTTNSVPAIVFITVTPVADVASSSLSLAPLVGGQYQLSLLAEPWQSYRLEASEDLIHWQPLTNLLATNLLTLLVDADAPNFPQRFYRAAQFSFAPELGGAQLGSNNQFQFTLAGEPGRNYQVQVSPNLVTWTPLTNVFMTNATRPFVDGDTVKFPSRFYRLVAP